MDVHMVGSMSIGRLDETISRGCVENGISI